MEAMASLTCAMVKPRNCGGGVSNAAAPDLLLSLQLLQPYS